MSFPPHIDHVLTTYGIRAETKAALYDLYLSMGGEALEVFADLADGVTSATMLEADDSRAGGGALSAAESSALAGGDSDGQSVASARRRRTGRGGGRAAGGVGSE